MSTAFGARAVRVAESDDPIDGPTGPGTTPGRGGADLLKRRDDRSDLPAASGVEVDREVIIDERTLPEGVDVERRPGHALLKVRTVRVESPEHFVCEKRNLGVRQLDCNGISRSARSR